MLSEGMAVGTNALQEPDVENIAHVSGGNPGKAVSIHEFVKKSILDISSNVFLKPL